MTLTPHRSGALLLAAVSALITLVASSAPAAALADPQPGRLRVHAPDDPQPRRLQRHTTEEITSFLRAFYGNHGPSEQDRVNRVSQLLKDKQAHFPETDVLLCRPGTPQSITVGQATAAPSAFVGWATVTTTWPSGVTDTFTAYVRTDSRPITLDDVICAG
ncbi:MULTISPECIES: hypothetical protein [Streptomyces]|uniref:hypothetical protein n=1 Tax=Streptomyces TaxID=1883 RepID=UPI0009A5199B|nr:MULTISPECIES: hypothetical protein [Streptomyces]